MSKFKNAKHKVRKRRTNSTWNVAIEMRKTKQIVQRTQRGMLLLSGDLANRQRRQQNIHAWLIVRHSKHISTCMVAQQCKHMLNLQHLSQIRETEDAVRHTK